MSDPELLSSWLPIMPIMRMDDRADRSKKESEWRRLKRLVLDAVSSPITRRVYNLALDEFIEWYDKENRCGFTKSTVNAWTIVSRE